jgi:hypothetical protein
MCQKQPNSMQFIALSTAGSSASQAQTVAWGFAVVSHHRQHSVLSSFRACCGHCPGSVQNSWLAFVSSVEPWTSPFRSPHSAGMHPDGSAFNALRLAYARDLMLPQKDGTSPTKPPLLSAILTRFTNPPQDGGKVPDSKLVPKSRCCSANRLLEVPQSGGKVPTSWQPAQVNRWRWFRPGSCTAAGRVPFNMLAARMPLLT